MEIRKLNRGKLKSEKEEKKPAPPPTKTPHESKKTGPSKKQKRTLPPKKKILYLILILIIIGEAALYNYSNINKTHNVSSVSPEIHTTVVTAHFYSLCMDITQHKTIYGSYPDAFEGMISADKFTYSTDPGNTSFRLTYDDGDIQLSYSSVVDYSTVFIQGETE